MLSYLIWVFVTVGTILSAVCYVLQLLEIKRLYKLFATCFVVHIIIFTVLTLENHVDIIGIVSSTKLLRDLLITMLFISYSSYVVTRVKQWREYIVETSFLLSLEVLLVCWLIQIPLVFLMIIFLLGLCLLLCNITLHNS